MASKAGIYMHLWRPEEIGITKASQLIEPLREGLKRMLDAPGEYRFFNLSNPSNGWGDYDGLVAFVTNYLSRCEETPEATVTVSR
jgi:hypothetical protein